MNFNYDFTSFVFLFYNFHPQNDARPDISLLKTSPWDKDVGCVRICTRSPRFRLTAITPVVEWISVTVSLSVTIPVNAWELMTIWQYAYEWGLVKIVHVIGLSKRNALYVNFRKKSYRCRDYCINGAWSRFWKKTIFADFNVCNASVNTE